MPVAFFPHLYSCETVYSVCSRFHFVTQCGSPRETALLLFGDANARLYTDVPSCLQHLQIASAGAIQATEQFLRQHSGLAAYLALMLPASRIALVQACQKGPPSIARARSGLNRYVGPQSVLKLCLVCAHHQLDADGVTFWAAHHQVPGVWMCDEHDVALSFAEVPQLESKRWILPQHVLVSAVQPQFSDLERSKMRRLKAVVQWMSLNHHLDTAILQVLLKDRLREAGQCDSELKWRTGEKKHLVKQLHQYACDLHTPDVQRLHSATWPEKLLSSDSRHYDPLTWSIALSWFGDVTQDGLANAYFNARARKPARDMFDALPHRERRVSAPARIYRALEQCDLKKSALGNGHITAYEIDRWLRHDPDLKKAWQRAMRQRTKANRVLEIKTFLASHPEALRVDILKACHCAYRWLETNDPDQLQRLLPWITPRHSRQLRLPLDHETPGTPETRELSALSDMKDAS
ncbi:TniQ family protein [Variovorax sp. HJSM1_2]|uniref:TniQ family protein n=1 Tax=Variovorax sp. HJSM1_2 TaxID=3366263 RepID=UPI003BCBB102